MEGMICHGEKKLLPTEFGSQKSCCSRPKSKRSYLILKILLKTDKLVYASTGCQSESTISSFMEEFGNFENINLLHCVSNYPLAPHNCNLGYIQYFKNYFYLMFKCKQRFICHK